MPIWAQLTTHLRHIESSSVSLCLQYFQLSLRWLGDDWWVSMSLSSCCGDNSRFPEWTLDSSKSDFETFWKMCCGISNFFDWFSMNTGVGHWHTDIAINNKETRNKCFVATPEFDVVYFTIFRWWILALYLFSTAKHGMERKQIDPGSMHHSRGFEW